ncbi:UNVERIFIED_CONTAM: hypothetical protein GTU68_058331 [Idotea baltica]|nr:hypothetical protein [Idotea baltica]
MHGKITSTGKRQTTSYLSE